MSIYLTNLKPDPKDERDYIFTSSVSGLPRSIDLRQYAGGIENQGNINSCTANAGVSACEIWAKRAGFTLDFSRLFLYYNERAEYPSLHGQDNGAYMRDICRCLNKQGVCLETAWPYQTGLVNAKPSDTCYTEATQYKVGRYERIPDGQIELVKAALAKGYPVIIGMYLRPPFFSAPSSDEYIWFIQTAYTQQPRIGSHAMLIVGYDEDKGSFIIENSWGDGWAGGGYFNYPYGFFTFDCHDMWVFTEFAGYNLPELWKPEYPDEQYATIARLYKACMGRAPDTEGLNYWTAEYKKGTTLQTIAQSFINSPEFISRYGQNVDDDTYIKTLYNNVLKRDPDPTGALYWKLRLNPLPQISRVDALCEFSESAENKAS